MGSTAYSFLGCFILERVPNALSVSAMQKLRSLRLKTVIMHDGNPKYDSHVITRELASKLQKLSEFFTETPVFVQTSDEFTKNMHRLATNVIVK